MKTRQKLAGTPRGPSAWIVRQTPDGAPVRIFRRAPISAEIAAVIARAYRVNRRVFGRDLPFFNFVLCDDDAVWKTESREYYTPWARAVALRDGTVVLRTPKKGGAFRAELEELAKHEINHAFWCLLHKNSRERWCPFWLAEGLACHIAGRQYQPPAGAIAGRLKQAADGMRLFPYRYRSDFLGSREDLVAYYALWSAFTGALLETYGSAVSAVILRHAKQPGYESFISLCRQKFGRPLDALARDFIRTRAEGLPPTENPGAPKTKKDKP